MILSALMSAQLSQTDDVLAAGPPPERVNLFGAAVSGFR
jgi:hypothetical protein